MKLLKYCRFLEGPIETVDSLSIQQLFSIVLLVDCIWARRLAINLSNIRVIDT